MKRKTYYIIVLHFEDETDYSFPEAYSPSGVASLTHFGFTRECERHCKEYAERSIHDLLRVEQRYYKESPETHGVTDFVYDMYEFSGMANTFPTQRIREEDIYLKSIFCDVNKYKTKLTGKLELLNCPYKEEWQVDFQV